MPKLVYNSILSWVAGWYYLIACEIITVGPAHYRLPGLGSLLMEAADKGEWGGVIGGLLTLLFIIVAMDLMVWQPLSTWSEKFRYEFAASAQPMHSLGMLDVFGGIGPPITRLVRAILRPIGEFARRAIESLPRLDPGPRSALARLGVIVRAVVLAASQSSATRSSRESWRWCARLRSRGRLRSGRFPPRRWPRCCGC